MGHFSKALKTLTDSSLLLMNLWRLILVVGYRPNLPGMSSWPKAVGLGDCSCSFPILTACQAHFAAIAVAALDFKHSCLKTLSTKALKPCPRSYVFSQVGKAFLVILGTP